MSTVIKKPTDSSTATSIVQDHQNCSSCPQFVNPKSGSGHEQQSDVLALVGYLAQLGSMQSEINALKTDLEAEKSKSAGFYQSLTKLSNTSRKVIWVLLVIPMLQFISCTAVVYFLGIQDELPSLLTWVLSSVSALSIVEMIILPIKFFTMENRMNEIERKLSENHDAA